MGVDADTTRVEISAADAERGRRAALCAPELADAITYDWAHIGGGITLAGGLYPIALGLLVTVIWFTSAFVSAISGGSPEPIADDLADFFAGAAAFSLGLAFVGVAWTGLVTIITLPCVYLVVWSLRLSCSIVWLGAFAGGVVGFIAALPFVLTLVAEWELDAILASMILFATGPSLATVLGQLGGAWGGLQSREVGDKSHWKKTLAEAGGWHEETGSPIESNAGPPQAVPKAPFQFGIRQLFWVSFWLSLLLTLIRLCGISFEFALPLLVGWLVFQLASLWLGGILVRRYLVRRARRQARST